MTHINGDHLVSTRAAVADVLQAQGMAENAERTRRGEMDDLPMMRAAIGAVERVVAGMFDA